MSSYPVDPEAFCLALPAKLAGSVRNLVPGGYHWRDRRAAPGATGSVPRTRAELGVADSHDPRGLARGPEYRNPWHPRPRALTQWAITSEYRLSRTSCVPRPR